MYVTTYMTRADAAGQAAITPLLLYSGKMVWLQK